MRLNSSSWDPVTGHRDTCIGTFDFGHVPDPSLLSKAVLFRGWSDTSESIALTSSMPDEGTSGFAQVVSEMECSFKENKMTEGNSADSSGQSFGFYLLGNFTFCKLTFSHRPLRTVGKNVSFLETVELLILLHENHRMGGEG